MKTISAVLVTCALVISDSSYAQNWIIFVPAEHDFRVLFPGPPDRSSAADGSVAFKATVEHDEYAVNYVVYRLPPGVGHTNDVRAELQQRIEARVGNDRGVRHVTEDGSDPGWVRYVFRYGPFVSIHRLAGHGARRYELEVTATSRGGTHVAMNTARDFFHSFRMGGIALPGFGLAGEHTLEAWCGNRDDPFSRAFCQYSVCLGEDHAKFPHCAALFRR